MSSLVIVCGGYSRCNAESRLFWPTGAGEGYETSIKGIVARALWRRLLSVVAGWKVSLAISPEKAVVVFFASHAGLQSISV